VFVSTVFASEIQLISLKEGCAPADPMRRLMDRKFLMDGASREHARAWLAGEAEPDLRRLGAYVVSPGAELTFSDVEEQLTADIDAAIAVAESTEAGLTSESRQLHGLLPLLAVREQWRGMCLPQLRAERDRLLRAWSEAAAAASYTADKHEELDTAPDAASAAAAVARWRLLDRRPHDAPAPAEADPPAPLPHATKADVHAAVLRHVEDFFSRADDPNARHHTLLCAETGSRKTGITLAHLRTMIETRKAAGKPHRAVTLVPAHRLGLEILARAQAEGIKAALFRGRGDRGKEKREPQPCKNLEAVDLARKAGADIRATVCGPAPGGARCAWRDNCDYFTGLNQAQAADLVIAAHNFVFDPLPRELQHDLAWVIIDEGFAALADREFDLTLSSLGPESLAAFPVLDEDKAPDIAATAELEALYARLITAARGCIGGYLTADALQEADITTMSGATTRLPSLTRGREVDHQMRPGMDPESRRAAAQRAAINGQLGAIAALSHGAASILSDGPTAAGFVSVRLDVRPWGSEIVLTVRGQRERAGWLTDLPVLMTDATGRIEDVRRVFPDAELAEVPSAAWPYVRVIQVTGGFGQSTLERHPTRIAELRDFIILATLDKPTALVVCHKATEDAFTGIPGVAVVHHNNVAGSDVHARVDMAITIGGAFASPEAVASIAAARGGGAVQVARPQRVTRASLLTSGAAVEIECMAYADPAVDAVHRGIYGTSITQGAGRIRPLERTAANPAVLWVFGNVALPFPADSVVPWSSVRPDRITRMIARGAVWLNPSDAALFQPELFKNAKAVERARGRMDDARTAVAAVTRHDPQPWSRLRYRLRGQGMRFREVMIPTDSATVVLAAIEAKHGRLVASDLVPLTDGLLRDNQNHGASDVLPRLKCSRLHRRCLINHAPKRFAAAGAEKGRISMATRDELVAALAARYASSSRVERGRILDEFTAVSSLHRKHAMRVLRAGKPGDRSGPRPARRLYNEAVREALVVTWEASDWICGKRLRPLLPILIEAMERHGHLQLAPEVRAGLLAMSTATIDRALRQVRALGGGRKRRHAPPSAAIRRSVPVRTFDGWDNPPPGFVEADLVAHSGPGAKGSFVQTLTVTDIATGWMECMPLLVREQRLLTESLSMIRRQMPFRLLGFDTDNDSVFMNDTVKAYCDEAGLAFTRCRPCRKNDQAWVEQKNGAVVRHAVGYRRYEEPDAAATLARLYAALRLFVNFFQPCFKLAGKTRDGAKVKKTYHPPATPYQRLLADERTSEAVRRRVTATYRTLDPVRLLRTIRIAQEDLMRIADRPGDHGTAAPGPALDQFLLGLRTAWQGGEVRPTSQPKPKAPRGRRRPDPLVTVTPQLREWFEAEPWRTSRELFERLQQEHPGVFPDGQVRTLQRRVKAWRHERAQQPVFGADPVDETPELTPVPTELPSAPPVFGAPPPGLRDI
jgi:hypothetical protein